jgi:RNA polymerase sigma factor (sigma-70 family)
LRGQAKRKHQQHYRCENARFVFHVDLLILSSDILIVLPIKKPSGAADRDRLEKKQLEEEVLKAIARLPKKQAAAVLMRIVQDQPYEIIAKALGCSEVTARIQVSRGRTRLSHWLSHLRPDSREEESR